MITTYTFFQNSKERFLTLIFIWINLCVFSQNKIVIIDSLTKERIPYANIWIEDGDLNFTANDEGYFITKRLNDKKTIVLSAVGYVNKTLRVKTIRDTVVLAPYVISLEETVVTAASKKRKQRVLIDKIKRNKIGYYIPGFRKAKIFAKYFKYDSKYKETPYINKIRLMVRSHTPEAKFNIRLFKKNKKGEPEGYIYKNNIIVTARKGKRMIEIDLEELRLKIPENGFFVGVEWLLIEENHGAWDTFEPGIGLIQLPHNKDSWYYRYGKWQPTWKLTEVKKFRGKYNHLALDLTLSN